MQYMRSETKKKRQFVIDVALKLFMDKGYENVSVDEIIAATNTSKGTFYHYFRSKDEIIGEIIRNQLDIIAQWVLQPPAKVMSLEGHINRLLLDLASNISAVPKLIRSLSALYALNESLLREYERQVRVLYDAIFRWLPHPQKAELLVTTYFGTVYIWCMQENDDLIRRMSDNLALVWTGLRHEDPNGMDLALSPNQPEVPHMKVAIIGGGLAGLTAASYLSENQHIEGTIFERSPQLGGRAFTYEKSGFTLNYGAHAIYGLDRHTLTTMERELGLSIGSKQVEKRKVYYEKFDQITPAPLDFFNLMRTGLLSAMQKVKFVGEITAIIANIHQIKNFRTLGDYLAQSNADETLKELWEHLVCSNFFITPEDARQVPGHVISSYYHNLFLSHRPVNYILGSWAVITNQLKQKIETSGRWELAMQEGVESIRFEDDKYWVKTKKSELAFDRIVFAMPVQQVVKLLKSTPWETALTPYENNKATEVMVYDVGLSEVVARPFSYISDMNHKMFISDVSATDDTLVPPGAQLLQGIAYLHDEDFTSEDERKAYLEERTQQMEALFDRHYPGWRDAIAVKRVSKKAMVQSVKNVITNNLLPNQVDDVPFYFCGDGCVGKGELAERAFSSARVVAQSIIKESEKMLQHASV